MNSRAGFVKPLAGIGGRAASLALRPVTGTLRLAAGVGRGAERRLVDRVLDGRELEQVPAHVLEDEHVQAAFRGVLASKGAARIIDGFFDSGLFEYFVERLLASDALWHLVDEIAQSPSAMAALSQQGLGFAGQVGGAVRERSRKADRRVERVAGRLRRHTPQHDPTDSDARRP